MAVRFIHDCDTGSDDAVAIFAATAHPELHPIAITTVNGNVDVAHTTENTLRVLDHAGARVPVYAGATRPFVRPDFPVPRAVLNRASQLHPEYLDFPVAVSRAEDQGAVSFLIDAYMDDANADVALVATGPLTNVALALATEPRLAARIPRLVIMGGAHGNGNVTASAEFNFWVDPEAAEAVLSAGIRDVVIVTLDATHSAPLSGADCDVLDGIGTPAARGAAQLIRHRLEHDQAAASGEEGGGEVASPVHDPMTVAYLVRPELFTETVRAHASVETSGGRTLGELIVDTRPWCPQPPNATVALRASGQVYREFLRAAFGQPASG
ncbi:nucleoside hydrolase [Streptomyces sp. A7024]|uniref:Nucleoside hydrolase n=1 Tax=Streptomyces coryli TaxID=1128680 RepID=A0A6G4TSI7_9ACTN|nr:nucleoside hydrolase [Streptomyces coryli]